MAKYVLTSPSGEKFEVTAPDDAPPEAVMDYAKKQWAMMSTPAAPTREQRDLASVSSRAGQGYMRPFLGAAQFMASVVPQPVMDAVGGAFGNPPVKPEDIDKVVRDRETKLNAAKTATGTGVDVAGFVGEMVNPLYAAGAGLKAGTMLGRAAAGAVTGGVGALAQPVVVEQDRPYAGQKIAQVGLGAGVGAVAAPVLGSLGDAITTRINNAVQKGARTAAAPQQADEMIVEALREIGQKIDDFPPDALAKIRKTVTDSLVAGKELDAAQLARMADFERLGMKPLAGQVTRDPSQWSNEYNLARSGDVGKPIAQRLIGQNQQLTEQIGNFGARNASDATQAGETVRDAAAKWVSDSGQIVRDAYGVARNSAGRDAEVPTEGLAREYARLLYEFGAENIPGALRARAREFGFAPAAGAPAKESVEQAAAFAKIKPRIPAAQQAVAAEAEAAKAVEAAKATYVAALQEVGKMQTLQARSGALADQWTPVPGMPRVPGRYGPTVELGEQAGAAAQDVTAIMRQRQTELRAAEEALAKAQEAAGKATRGIPAGMLDAMRKGEPVLPDVKPLTANDAELLLKMTNGLQGADPTKNAALKAFNQAIKSSIKQMDADGGPFAVPRTLAAKRFDIMDAIPALEAAAKGEVPADTFVQRFVIGNKDSKQVIGLTKILAKDSPEAMNEARNQVGAHLFRAAFGENMAGDAPFAPERFAKVLRDIGDAKLSAFYTPAQISDLKALSRVGAYINKLPFANNANVSQSGNVLMERLQQIPGVGMAISSMGPVALAATRGLEALSRSVTRGQQVNSALNPAVQATEAALPPAAAQLRDLLAGSIAAGSAATVAGTTFGRDTR